MTVTYPPGTDRVTVGGVTLSARVWALLRAAYDATPGLSASLLSVSQGSWHDGTLSGGTHSGGGAFDLRVRNLPRSTWEPLVVELRKRNVCAWVRDVAHGWTAGDHVHGIVRDEPGLSRPARSQVALYDRGRDGLASNGPDPHPRPVQHPFTYPPTPAPLPVPHEQGEHMILTSPTGSRWLLTGGHLTSLDGGTAAAAVDAGLPAFTVTNETAWANIQRTYPLVRPPATP